MVSKGELKQKAQQKSLLVDALSVAEPNDYCDVRVVTLKQWLTEQAYDQAWLECSDITKIQQHADQLLSTKFSHGKEFIEISSSGIQVCIDSAEVDDHAIDRAIKLLSEIDNLTTDGKFELGEEITIQCNPTFVNTMK